MYETDNIKSSYCFMTSSWNVEVNNQDNKQSTNLELC